MNKKRGYSVEKQLKTITKLLTVAMVLLLVVSVTSVFGLFKQAPAAEPATTTEATSEETTLEETTVEGETTAQVETTVEGETTLEETTVEGQTTLPPATTNPAPPRPKPQGITFPINGSMSKVIEFYNQYANAMKTYKGKVTVTKKDGTTSTIQSITGGSVVKNIALDLLPNDYTEKPTYTFVNGKSTKDNKDLSKWLPRGDYAKMSELSPTGTNGVKSATCVANGSGCKVTIVMNDDKTSGANALRDKPKYVSKCMDTLDLGPEDLEPFTLQDANVNYTGCKIEAVFNAQGLLTKLDITTPANITGKLKYSLIGINADVTGTYRGNYTFAY